MSFLRLGYGIIRTKLFHSPYSANFKITERCNLRCPTCSIWKCGSRKRELSIEEIAIGLKNVKKLGLTRLVITGGEPLIRKDLVEIIRIATELNLTTTLLTNGLMANDSLLKSFFDVGLNHIGISLDFITPELQDTFYNAPGAWRTINQTIRSALKWNKKGIVYTMTTILPENISEVLPLLRIVEAMGAHFVINPVMGSAHIEPERLFSGSTPLPEYSEEQLTEIKQIYDQLIHLKRRGHNILGSEKYLKNTVTWIEKNDIRWHCHAGQYYFNIFSDGGVAPCNEYPPILSICDPDFVQRFYSDEFQKKAEQIRINCSGCTYSCWRELSTLLTDPDALLKQTVSYVRQFFLK